MTWPIRRGYYASLLIYAAGSVFANGQALDPLLEINNQVDTSTAQALTSSTQQSDQSGQTTNQQSAQRAAATNTAPGGQASTVQTSSTTSKQLKLQGFFQGPNAPPLRPKFVLKGGVKPYLIASGGLPFSGYKPPANPNNPPAIPTWDKGVTLIESFNEKNSFIGRGVTDTYSSQLGWTFSTPIGTAITPTVSYAGASTGSGQSNTYHSNGYGVGLNFQQKILPAFPVFGTQPPQSGAVYNVGDTSKDPACPNDPTNYPDHYPNCDVQALLGLSWQDTNLASRGKEWAYDTQDGYNATPGVQFDYFRKKSSNGKFDPLPAAVNIVSTYSYLSVDGHNGESGSNGLLSVSDRNTWLWVLHPAGDCDHTSLRTISLIESNTLFHDTDQEPIAAPTTPVAYQNWARFGLAITYTDVTNAAKGDPEADPDCSFIVPLIKLEYDYDAFNAQYEAHTVTLTMNFNF
jgi:hypothetical protein